MLINILFLVGGLLLVLGGANALIDGATSMAKRMGVSDLVVGLTVVAMGTSAPELVVSVLAAAEGSAPMAIGNLVGSNIFNLLVIIGLTAVVRPIKIERSVMSVDIPIVILAAVVMVVLGNSRWLDGDANVVSRVDGIFLLIAFGLYMRHTIAVARRDALPTGAAEEPSAKQMPVWRAVVYVAVGLCALVGGGELFVKGASGVALRLGMSDAVVGLTIVAAGTSLPELATSIAAALKGNPGLAVGNVIGSCIFNVFFVLGVSSVIMPLPFGDVGQLDLLTLLAASLLFLLFGWIIKVRTITRVEGALMFALYVVYTVLLIRSI